MYVNILEYPPFGKFSRYWEVDLQVDYKDDLSINIVIHSYREKDFKKMINDAKDIYNKLKLNK